jgi:hypothetical protein
MRWLRRLPRLRRRRVRRLRVRWLPWGVAWVARTARAAAYPADRAACAKSHDLTPGLAKDSAKLGLQSISLSLVATLRKLHPTDSISPESGLSALVAMALSGDQLMARAVVTPRPPMVAKFAQVPAA